MTHSVRHSRGELSATLHELEDLRTRMDQLMHAVFPVGGHPEFGTAEPWAPLADVVDTEDAYLMELKRARSGPGPDRPRRSRKANSTSTVRSGPGTHRARSAGRPDASAGSTAATILRNSGHRAHQGGPASTEYSR